MDMILLANGGNVTSAGLQVTLCDPIWHVSSGSDEDCYKLLYPITFLFFNRLSIIQSPALWFLVILFRHRLFIDESRSDARNNNNMLTGPEMALFLYALTLSNINRFSKIFTIGITRKFAIILSIQILPHLKCVASLLYKMSVSGANCRSVSLITPLVSSIAGLSTSSSSNVDTLNI